MAVAKYWLHRPLAISLNANKEPSRYLHIIFFSPGLHQVGAARKSVFFEGIYVLKNIFFACLLAPAIVVASPSDSGTGVAEKLTALLSEMRSFQADFKQITLDGRGNHIQETSGELAVKRPGLLYWKTRPPLAQLVVSDGQQLWFYDPDLEQVTVQVLDQRVTQTPALLLSGEVASLQSSYEITGEQLGQGWVFQLTPRDPESLFEQLKLTFVGGQLTQMHLADSLGQRSSFEFMDAEINPELSAELFYFSPPEGVDVIAQ